MTEEAAGGEEARESLPALFARCLAMEETGADPAERIEVI